MTGAIPTNSGTRRERRSPGRDMIRKGRAYGRGMGYVLRRHGWGWGARLYWVARPLARATLSLLRGNRLSARYAQQVAIGRLEGALGRLLTHGEV